MLRRSLISRFLPAGVLLGLFGLPALPALGADTAATPRKIATVEGITEYQLDNGLRVLLFPDPSASRVTVNMTVLVGSRHEGYGETGMAHLLEHMAFKGTPRHPNVPKALRDHGADFNGTTWVDRTNYYETMNATDENLEFGIRLEADRLVNSFVRREDLVSEMTVVRSEFEAGENSPSSILSQRMMAAAYEWHNYGKSTIGNRSDIERVPIENLQAFYKKFYQTDNALLVVAGKFDPARALSLVSKYFGDLKRPTRKLDATYTEEPAQDGERTVTLRRVGTVGLVGVVYHIAAGAHEDFAAVEVLNNILVSEPSGRLYKALVASKMASSVSGTAYGWHDPGVLEITARAGEKHSLQEVRKTLVDTLEGLATAKFTAEEVERARRELLKNRRLLMNDSNRIGVTLSDWAARGDWRLFFLHRDRVEKVTPDDVARVAGRYLQQNNRTVGLYIPSEKAQRAEIPTTPSVAELVKDYKGQETVAAGEAFDPTPENLDKRTVHSQLPSGIKVALLPKKSRGEEVHLDLTLRFGNETSLKEYKTACSLMGRLMTRGTRGHTRQQLQDELDKLEAKLNVSSGLGTLTVAIVCKRQNLPAVVHLMGEVLREPTFPQEEFDVLKTQSKKVLEAGLKEPQILASRTFQQKIHPYSKDNIRYVPTVEEAIARMDAVVVDQVRTLYREQVNGQVGELAIVGDFDPDSIPRLVGDMLKDWKATVPYKRIASPARTDVPGERIVIQTPDKANAVFVGGHTLALTDTDPDYAALQVADFLFGQAPLASRLSNRVRGKDGLSYGVGSQMVVDSQDKAGIFLMFAICNPKNIDKVDGAIAEELAKILKEGIGDKELAEAKTAYLETRKLGSDAQIVSQLSENAHLGRTFAYETELRKQIEALTADQVLGAFRKHIVPGRVVVVRAGDFKEK